MDLFFHYRPILYGENIFDQLQNYFLFIISGATYGTGLNTCSSHLESVKSISVSAYLPESGFWARVEGLYARILCIALMMLSVTLCTRLEWYPYPAWPRHSLIYRSTHFWKPVRSWIWVLWWVRGSLASATFPGLNHAVLFVRFYFLPVWERAKGYRRVSQQLLHVLPVPIELRNHQTDRIRHRLIVFFFCSGILSIPLKILIQMSHFFYQNAIFSSNGHFQPKCPFSAKMANFKQYGHFQLK